MAIKARTESFVVVFHTERNGAFVERESEGGWKSLTFFRKWQYSAFIVLVALTLFVADVVLTAVQVTDRSGLIFVVDGGGKRVDFGFWTQRVVGRYKEGFQSHLHLFLVRIAHCPVLSASKAL